MLIHKLNKAAKRKRRVPVNDLTTRDLSRLTPYYGFIDVSVAGVKFAMFSNNDDFVAQEYFWHGPDAYEPLSLRLWQSIAKTSPIVFDVGSYSGVYSLAAASSNKLTKVYAFEPLGRAFNRITVNKDANQLSNIQAFNTAISNTTGTAQLNVYSGESILVTGSSIIEDATTRTIHSVVEVPVTTLDDIVTSHAISANIPLIKIDAEGAEHLILEGAKELIKTHTPTILCEFLPVAKTDQIEEILTEYEYNIFHIDDAKQTLTRCEHIQVSDKINSLNTLLTTKTYDEVMELIDA